MQSLILIPARYASSRFPGKPLAVLRGASGLEKTLIQRSWEAAIAVPGNHRVVVATDDDRIAEAAQGFGAEIVMTDPDCANGTERCADALARLNDPAEIIVNLQGDAPLTPAWFIEDLIAGLTAAPVQVGLATPVLLCDAEALAALRADRAAGRVGGTTAVMTQDSRALYFSKEVLPFAGADVPVFHHVGVYAYRRDVLMNYPAWPVGPLEQAEGLEQLRFLENGRAIQCVEVEARGRAFWELNNPGDTPRIEAMLKEIGLE